MLLLIGCHGATSIGSAGDSGVDSGPGTSDSGDSGDSAADSNPPETGTSDDSGDSDPPDSAVDTGAIEIPPACPLFGEPVQTGLVSELSLDEISGVAPSYKNPGTLWVMMDHGNAAEVYAIDEFGTLQATVTVDGVENVDWEDIDLVPCDAGTCLVIADTGDNEHVRTDLALVVIEEPLLDGVTTEYVAPATRYGFSWPNAGEDNETVTHTQDGRFVLVSKRGETTAGVYTLPMFRDGEIAESHGEIETRGELPEGSEQIAAPVTSAALWPDDSLLLVRTYPGTVSFVLPDGIDGVELSELAAVPSPLLPHDEAIAVDVVRDGYWTIPEADPIEGSPIWFVPCVR